MEQYFLNKNQVFVSLEKNRNFNIYTFILGISLFALCLPACDSRVHTRGNFLDPEKLVEIRPGEISRNEVKEILGSPSSVIPFSDDTWYYISQRTETLAFFQPEVMKRQVVVISFNKEGKVTNVETLGIEEGQNITPVARKTMTHGNELTVLEQLVGNLNRFSANSKRQNQNSEEQ